MKIFAITNNDGQHELHSYDWDSIRGPYATIPSDVIYAAVLIIREDGIVYKNRLGEVGKPMNKEELRIKLTKFVTEL